MNIQYVSIYFTRLICPSYNLIAVLSQSQAYLSDYQITTQQTSQGYINDKIMTLYDIRYY